MNANEKFSNTYLLFRTIFSFFYNRDSTVEQIDVIVVNFSEVISHFLYCFDFFP